MDLYHYFLYKINATMPMFIFSWILCQNEPKIEILILKTLSCACDI